MELEMRGLSHHRGELVIPVVLAACGFAVYVGSGPANSASDVAECHGVPATIVGAGGSERLVGTNHRDVILARSGFDEIDGRRGRDRICGGSGDDSIDGGGGKDLVFGGAGDDNLWGGPAADVIGAANGSDFLDGGSGGRDRLFGRAGQDLLLGGAGLSDECHGGSPSDDRDGRGDLAGRRSCEVTRGAKRLNVDQIPEPAEP